MSYSCPKKVSSIHGLLPLMVRRQCRVTRSTYHVRADAATRSKPCGCSLFQDGLIPAIVLGYAGHVDTKLRLAHARPGVGRVVPIHEAILLCRDESRPDTVRGLGVLADVTARPARTSPAADKV